MNTWVKVTLILLAFLYAVTQLMCVHAAFDKDEFDGDWGDDETPKRLPFEGTLENRIAWGLFGPIILAYWIIPGTVCNVVDGFGQWPKVLGAALKMMFANPDEADE